MSAKASDKSVSITGFIKIVAFFTSVLSIVTVFDYLHRYIELFSHFRLQYLVASLACAFIFLVLQKYKLVFLMSVIVGLNMMYVLPWYFDSKGETSKQYAVQIKIIHSNVKTNNTNYQKLIDLVEEESPDLLITQEVSTDWLTKLRPLENSYPYQQASPREDNFGIAIFSKYPIDEIREVYWGPSNIPSLKASLIVSGHRISLITTHPLPPVSDDYYHSRNSQLNEVALVSKNVDHPLILIGDLNVTMWSSDYMALETGTNLVNARKGFGILPTWPTILPMFMIPIDHCLVSSDFQVLEIKVGKNVGSDHLPLIVDLGLKS